MLYRVKDLDTQLSLKIGDYVNDNGDGLIFTQLARLNYLEKAYNKTVRLLNISMEKYAPQFAKRHYLINIDNIINSKVRIENGYSKISQIVVHYDNEEGQQYTTFAAKLDEESFLATKYKLNDQRSPDFKEKIIYYSVINDEIHFLPESDNYFIYRKVNILFLKDGIEIKSVNDEISLEKNYIDLILSFAAAEAMVDLGRGDKANAFYDDAYSQIKLLQQLALVKKKEAGNV